MPSTRPTVDPVLDILEELGYDFDELDGDGYKRSIREAIFRTHPDTGGKTADPEKFQILNEEFKRIRRGGKKPVEFKEKKTTIKAAKLLPGTATTKPDDLKQAQIDQSSEDKSQSLQPDILNDIAKSVESIATLLKRQLGVEKKQQRDAKIKQDKDNKSAREDKLEGKPKDKKTGLIPKSIAKPAIGFFGRIKDFIFNIGIGAALYKMHDWITDPEHEDKIKKFSDFLVEHAPKILAGLAALALLPILGGILGTLGMLMGGISLLGGVVPLIPLILKALLIAAAIGVTGWGINKLFVMNERRKLKNRFGGTRDFIEEGMLADELAIQYGSGASQKERDQHLTDQEKNEANFLDIYRKKLRERGDAHFELVKWQKQMDNNKKAWEKRGLDINNLPKFEQGVYDRVNGRILEFQEKTDNLTSVIEEIKSQLRFGGKTLEEIKSLHAKGLYHQTGISKAGEKDSAYGLGYSKSIHGWDTDTHKFLKKYSDQELLKVFPLSEEQQQIEVPDVPSDKSINVSYLPLGTGGDQNQAINGGASDSSGTPYFGGRNLDTFATADLYNIQTT